jgi:hypothetical protein
MYKSFTLDRNEQIDGCLKIINKEKGHIQFILDNRANMYIFYEVPDCGSDC